MCLITLPLERIIAWRRTNNLVCPAVESSNIGLLDYIQWLPDLHNTVYVQFLAFLVKGTLGVAERVAGEKELGMDVYGVDRESNWPGTQVRGRPLSSASCCNHRRSPPG